MSGSRGSHGERRDGQGPERRTFEADTLAWAAQGDPGLCACPECWAALPIWHYVRILEETFRRVARFGGRQALADHVWVSLAASPRRRWLWRFGQAARARAAEALLEAGRRQGWNPGQVYEIALRGLAIAEARRE